MKQKVKSELRATLQFYRTNICDRVTIPVPATDMEKLLEEQLYAESLELPLVYEGRV